MCVVCFKCVSSLLQVCDYNGSNILVMCGSSASQGCDECVYWLSICAKFDSSRLSSVCLVGQICVESVMRVSRLCRVGRLVCQARVQCVKCVS